MPDMTARVQAARARRVRGVRKYTMRRERALCSVDERRFGAMRHARAVRPAARWRPRAMRHVNIRVRPAVPKLRPMRDAPRATDMPAHANMRRKMRRAAADVGCELWSTNSTMHDNVRSAADMGSKVRPATTWTSGKMRSAATGLSSKMRRTAADVRGAARMSAATGMTASAGPLRRRSGTSRHAQAQGNGSDAYKNGSRPHHDVLPKALCPRDAARMKPLQTKRKAIAMVPESLPQANPGNVTNARVRVMLRCTGPMRAMRSIAFARLAMDAASFHGLNGNSPCKKERSPGRKASASRSPSR